jgi:hypothetical protein
MRTKFHVLTPQRLAIFSANRSARVLFV